MREQLARDYYRRLYGPTLSERIKYAWVTIGADNSKPEGESVGSLGKGKQKQTPKARKWSIQQASNELADRGYRLIPKPVRQDLKAGKTWYAVVAPDGTTRAMTGAEIAEFIRDQRSGDDDWAQRAINTIKEALAAKESLKERFARAWNEAEPQRYSLVAVQGLPRRALPQLKGGKANDFIRWLKRRGVGCHQTTMPPGGLLPIQRDLDNSKVQGIARKAAGGWEGPPLIVSSDGSILDGHHRWAAHRQAAPMQAVPVVQVNAGITELLELAWEWQDGESDLKEMFARAWAGEILRYAKKFREEDVNRDDDGQFAEKPGTGKSKAKTTAKGKAKTKQAKKAKKKLTPEERKAKAHAEFEALMATKSKADQAAFRKARAEGIRIPPAWTEVTYYGKAADIRARGRDAAARRQSLESPEYRQRISDENNARISRTLKPRMDELRNELRLAAAGGDEEAKVLYLIAMTGFRIGGKGDGKAKEPAYGASTLLGEHVKVRGNTVTFDFPGKKGVRQLHRITDPVIAKMMKGAKKGQPIFATRDAKVRKVWQQRYGGEKVHDIRHVVATEVAEQALSQRVPPYPKTVRERARLVNEIAAEAAKKLGNEPNQARDTYIDPAIWKRLKGKS